MADSNCKISLASSLSSKTLLALVLALELVCFWLIIFLGIVLVSLFLDLKDLLLVLVAPSSRDGLGNQNPIFG